MKYVDYVAAGQNRGTLSVFLTLLATILGASATLGVAAKAETMGFPSAWWLFSGAVGLALQGIVLSRRIRESDAKTLPELACRVAGSAGQRVVAAVVAISWPGVVAAQLVAFAGIWEAVVGCGGTALPIIGCAVAVVAYTLVGGQRAVVGTDVPQMLLLAVGFCGMFLWVFSGRCGGTPVPKTSIRLLSGDFGLREAVLSMMTVGGAYFLGPDIASRAFVARDGKTARRAVLTASPALLAFGAAIAICGMWAAANAPGDGNPILRIAALMPRPLRLFLTVGIACAILSSVDTCLVNAAAITAGDLFGVRSVRATRIAVVAVGVASTAMALSGGDIIGVLLKAYSVYVPGVVCPLAVAICAGRVNRNLWLAAVAAGGLCGLAGTVFPSLELLPAAGMALSLALALAARERGR